MRVWFESRKFHRLFLRQSRLQEFRPNDDRRTRDATSALQMTTDPLDSLFCRTEAVLKWLADVVYQVDVQVPIDDFLLSWKDGKGLCAVVHYHRPDLIDYSAGLLLQPEQRIDLAINATATVSTPALGHHSSLIPQLGVPVFLRAKEWVETVDHFVLVMYFHHLFYLWYEPRDIKFSGWLYKLGGKQTKKWNNRYFMIEDFKLYYYTKLEVFTSCLFRMDLHHRLILTFAFVRTRSQRNLSI